MLWPMILWLMFSPWWGYPEHCPERERVCVVRSMTRPPVGARYE